MRRWLRNDLHGRWELGGTPWTIGVRIRIMGPDERLLFDVYEGADLVAVRSTLKSAQAYVERRIGRAPTGSGFFARWILDPKAMQRAAIADHARMEANKRRRS